MTEYLISVVGMTVLSVVVDLILPSGKMSAFVRSIASLFLFFVIVSPILKFTRNKDAINDLSASIEQTFYYDISQSQIESTKNTISAALKKQYNASFDVEIGYESKNGVANILSVDVFVANSESELNSNDIEAIETIIKQYCGNVEVRVYAR